ncbi:MAG TPA: kelch repeat-containing protein, partial [Acidimicrobiales bacterium]|nr:kelch repeat-containing protein [Acidimicrobiales bacterium]
MASKPLRPALRLIGATVVTSAAVLIGGPVLAASSPPTLQWTPDQPRSSPPPLAYAAAAYDGDTAAVVLFGGVEGNGTLSDRTWIWNGSTWDQAPVNGQQPAARETASLAFDPTLHQLILFGGRGADGTLLDDTWAWNGAAWVLAGSPTQPAPDPREGASLAYDRSGDLVLFGGNGYAPPTGATSTSSTTVAVAGSEKARADTWRWTAQGWMAGPAAGPPARSSAALAYDSASHQTVLYGGLSATAKPLGDTWAWDGSSWAPAKPAASPPSRSAAVADNVASLGGPLLLTGSTASGPAADGWLWSGGSWIQTRTKGPASARQGAAGAFDVATSTFVLFGGAVANATMGDTQLLTATAGSGGSTSTTVAKATTTLARPTTTAGPRRPAPSTTAPAARRPPPTTVSHPGTTTGGGSGPVALGAPALVLQTPVHAARPGALVPLTGAGFAPGAPVEISFHSTLAVLGWATTDGQGRFSKVVAVPADARPGEHHFVATGQDAGGQSVTLSVPVLVLGAHHA